MKGRKFGINRGDEEPRHVSKPSSCDPVSFGYKILHLLATFCLVDKLFFCLIRVLAKSYQLCLVSQGLMRQKQQQHNLFLDVCENYYSQLIALG